MHASLSKSLIYLTLFLVSQTVLYLFWDSRLFSIVLHKVRRPNDAGSNTLLSDIALQWYPPDKNLVNDLTKVLDSRDIYGYIFDSSTTPSSLPYSTFNFCNMPRVRGQEYVRAPPEYKLRYVEVIHRHHKRTPYAANTFPRESYPWNCDDEALYYYGAPLPENDAAAVSWRVYTSEVNPLAPKGFEGSCHFPQITKGGLMDSRQHGRDLYGVYHDLLKFLPDELDDDRLSFRVTNNQITSQVAGQVILGMYPESNHRRITVLVQPPSVDSLEPGYSCPAASRLFAQFGVGSKDRDWLRHLRADQSVELFSRLDAVSGINQNDAEWHEWFDHYFDNLAARLCHQKPLPCNIDNPDLCVTRENADAVFRRGLYEYSLIYRDTAALFPASVASYGIWVAELAANLRNIIQGKEKVIYRHNFAHDGSIAKLLSFLQVNVMVWPGMGSEMVFELYSKEEKWYLRVLWSGQVLVSSNPSLGRIDMMPVETFLEYIDGLVGVDASKVPPLCSISTN